MVINDQTPPSKAVFQSGDSAEGGASEGSSKRKGDHRLRGKLKFSL